MTTILKSQTTDFLIEVAKTGMMDMRQAVDSVIDAVLNELEERMSEEEFIQLCETL